MFTNTALGYPPCTAQACLEILKYYDIPLSGKRAVVVGRSLVVGKPAAMMLDRENATVTICNSRTQNLPALCKEADVVVVAMGKRGFIGADCLREGQTVVDVGIHVGDDGKLCGDVRGRARGGSHHPRAGRCGHRDHLRAGGPCGGSSGEDAFIKVSSIYSFSIIKHKTQNAPGR